jgi:hypothetical protein
MLMEIKIEALIMFHMQSKTSPNTYIQIRRFQHYAKIVAQYITLFPPAPSASPHLLLSPFLFSFYSVIAVIIIVVIIVLVLLLLVLLLLVHLLLVLLLLIRLLFVLLLLLLLLLLLILFI